MQQTRRKKSSFLVMLHHISLGIQQTLGTNKFHAQNYFPFSLHCILFIILSCNSMQKIAGTKHYFLVVLHHISLSSKTGCSQLLAKKKKKIPITPQHKHQLQHDRIQHTFSMKQFYLVAASISLHLLSLHETLCCSTYIKSRSTVNELLTALHKTDSHKL